MNGYIEKKTLEAALNAGAAADSDSRRRAWAKAICILHDIPAADVVPVVHGKWIDEDFPEEKATVRGFAVCSACGELSHKAEHGYNILSKYCPNCGAKMDGGQP